MQLSMDEFARCLDIPASTIERWIRQGRIPVRRKGNVCEFNQPIIEKWAEANHLHFHPPGTRTEAQDEEESENNADSLLSVMRRGGVYYDIEGGSVDAVLREAVERVPYFDTPEKKEKLDTVMAILAQGLKFIGAMLTPFMPETARKIWDTLGIGDQFFAMTYADLADMAAIAPGTPVEKPAPLFPKFETD